MNRLDLKKLGTACKRYRKRKGILQLQVALETGYNTKTISMFECGNTNNAKILAWYINHGMPIEYVRGCYNGR